MISKVFGWSVNYLYNLTPKLVKAQILRLGLQTPTLFSEQPQPLLDQQLFKAAEYNGGQLSLANNHNHHYYYNHQHLNTMEWVKPRSQQDLPAESKVAYKIYIINTSISKYLPPIYVDWETISQV